MYTLFTLTFPSLLVHIDSLPWLFLKHFFRAFGSFSAATVLCVNLILTTFATNPIAFVFICTGDIQQITSGQITFASAPQMTVAISKDFIQQAAAESGVTIGLNNNNNTVQAQIYTEQPRE